MRGEKHLNHHVTRCGRLEELNWQASQAAVIQLLTDSGISGLTMENVEAVAC